MDSLTDEEFEAANERGRIEFETKPHAASARYDRQTGLMTLELHNGCAFSFPSRQVQGMEGATDEQIEAVDLGITGYGLHWEKLDADITVPDLLAGRFGTARFMKANEARLGRKYEELLHEHARDRWDKQATE